MNNCAKTYPLPKVETSVQKQMRAINIQKTEIYNKFLLAHPKLTDDLERMVYQARFNETTIEGFVKRLDGIARKAKRLCLGDMK